MTPAIREAVMQSGLNTEAQMDLYHGGYLQTGRYSRLLLMHHHMSMYIACLTDDSNSNPEGGSTWKCS